jgi:hypothetical protein
MPETLIDNALTVSKGGYGQALALLKGAKVKATAALMTAERAGATVPVKMTADLAESLKTALLQNAVKSGGVTGAVSGQALTAASERLTPALSATFGDIEKAASTSDVMNLTPTQADLLKTQLQRESRMLYAQRGAPNGPKAIGMDATERAEFATQLNTAIDGIAQGYKAANAQAKPLIGAVRGIKQAIRPSGNLYQAMVRPAVGAVLGEETGRRTGVNPIVGAIAGAAMTSPAGMSREAILLSHPAVQAALRQLPRAAAAALRAAIVTRAPQPPSPGSAPEKEPQ